MITTERTAVPSKGSRRQLGRYLGAAYLFVFVGSAVSGALWPPLSDGITPDKLAEVGNDPTLLRWSAVIELFITSVGIVVLGSLLYIILRKQNQMLSLFALGWWVAEAITLAMSTIGAFLLVPVSQAYVEAGTSESGGLLAMADTLVRFDRLTWEMHMVFFAVGGLLWYFLMYQGRVVPRWLAATGFGVVSLGFLSTLALFISDADLFYLGFPTGAFEVLLGIWLITKGLDRIPSEWAPS